MPHYGSFLGLALLAIALGLVALIGGAVYISGVLRSAAESMSSDAAPAIVALKSIDVDVQELAATLEELLAGMPGDVVIRRSRIQRTLERAHDDFQAYMALPASGSEVGLPLELQRQLEEMDLVARRILAEPAPPPVARTAGELASELHDAASGIDRALLHMSRLKAAELQSLSDRVSALRHRALPVILLLNVIAFAVAVAAIVIAYELVRRAAVLEQKAREQSERRAGELEAFSVRIAHDLLSPLMTVSLALGLAEQRLPEAGNDRTRTALERARASLHSVKRLVNGLLAFARAGAQKQPGARADLVAVVQEVMESFGPIAEQAGVELRTEALVPSTVACSPGVLTSLLSNLVQNAIKFVKGREVRRVEVRVLEQTSLVRVEVEDTGPGIAPGAESVIFEPYVRIGAHAGIGLGLATVKRLAEAHGGAVGVWSEPGAGATFWFTLPVVPADDSSEPGAESEEPG